MSVTAAQSYAGSYASAAGTIVETGDQQITIKTASGAFLTFDADAARFEMTTGLSYAGEIIKGQKVLLVYKPGPEDGFVQAEYILFNPDNQMAADIETCLQFSNNNGFLSDDGEYLLYTDTNTEVIDSLGRKTELRAGQYILGWFREAVHKHPNSAILSKAVVLNIADGVQTNKHITITESGDVLLDDGPIAKLNEFQAEFCLRNNMAPVRLIAEALGYTVEWEPDQTIYITKEDYSLNFDIGKDFYQLNDKFVKFSGKPFTIFQNRVFADFSVFDALITLGQPAVFNCRAELLKTI